MKLSKTAKRLRRKVRIRKKISGTPERPRLVVYRSNAHIYAQIIDDVASKTLVSASSLAMSRSDKEMKLNKECAAKVGKEIARLAMENNITTVVFDRNGYLYHGRVKALAEGARDGGLKF